MNDRFSELDELLKGFVEGTLTAEQNLRLEELLRNDPEARQRYLDYTDVESMLSAHNVKMRQSAEPTRKPNQKKKKRVKKVKPAKSSKTIWAVAATLFLASGLFYYLNFLSQKAYAVVAEVSGDMIINSESGPIPITKGMEIHENILISSRDKKTSVKIMTFDGSEYLVTSKNFGMSNKNNVFGLNLKDGFLKADVRKKAFGDPVSISTPDANMKIIGTKLRVNLDKDSTTLVVDEGKVKFSSKSKTLEVNTDQLVQSSGGDIIVRNVQKYRVKKLKIISAFYGEGDTWIEVTDELQKRSTNSRLILTGKFVELAGDPAYGKAKSLKVTYSIDGMEGATVFFEYLTDKIHPSNLRTEIELADLL